MEIDKVLIVINKICYQGIENTSSNWTKCDLCDFYKNGKCCANKDLIRFCDAFDNVYWQDVLISIKNKYNSNNDDLIIDMINNLKREDIYKNESV